MKAVGNFLSREAKNLIPDKGSLFLCRGDGVLVFFKTNQRRPEEKNEASIIGALVGGFGKRPRPCPDLSLKRGGVLEVEVEVEVETSFV